MMYLSVGTEGVRSGHGLHGDARLQRVLGLDCAHAAGIGPRRPTALVAFPAAENEIGLLALLN